MWRQLAIFALLTCVFAKYETNRGVYFLKKLGAPCDTYDGAVYEAIKYMSTSENPRSPLKTYAKCVAEYTGVLNEGAYNEAATAALLVSKAFVAVEKAEEIAKVCGEIPNEEDADKYAYNVARCILGNGKKFMYTLFPTKVSDEVGSHCQKEHNLHENYISDFRLLDMNPENIPDDIKCFVKCWAVSFNETLQTYFKDEGLNVHFAHFVDGKEYKVDPEEFVSQIEGCGQATDASSCSEAFDVVVCVKNAISSLGFVKTWDSYFS